MTEQYYQLRLTIACYIREEHRMYITSDYFDRIITTWNEMNKHSDRWDKDHAEAALLHNAVQDGVIKKDQLTLEGNAILDRYGFIFVE